MWCRHCGGTFGDRATLFCSLACIEAYLATEAAWLPRLPSPSEIRARSAEVRAGWNATTERSRRGWAEEEEAVEVPVVAARELGLE